MKLTNKKKIELKMVKICPSCCYNGCDNNEQLCNSCGHQFPRYKLHEFICKVCNKTIQIEILESNLNPQDNCVNCLMMIQKKEIELKKKQIEREKEEKEQKEYEERQRKYQESIKNSKPAKSLPKKKKRIESKDINDTRANFQSIEEKSFGVKICGSCGKPIHYNSGFPKCGCN
ncbi:hypothetical protein [Neobacillus drentensis]|uniref:hypothetical protein n=1 Tax=Neobacillus drentensis TaxID=220684 RepID=UPI0030008970